MTKGENCMFTGNYNLSRNIGKQCVQRVINVAVALECITYL